MHFYVVALPLVKSHTRAKKRQVQSYHSYCKTTENSDIRTYTQLFIWLSYKMKEYFGIERERENVYFVAFDIICDFVDFN